MDKKVEMLSGKQNFSVRISAYPSVLTLPNPELDPQKNECDEKRFYMLRGIKLLLSSNSALLLIGIFQC